MAHGYLYMFERGTASSETTGYSTCWKRPKSEIEESVGAELVWHRHESLSFFTINVRKDGSIDDLEKHDEIRAWMLEYLPKLKEVMDPRLEEILKEEIQEP